jgi:hypothetical protein
MFTSIITWSLMWSIQGFGPTEKISRIDGFATQAECLRAFRELKLKGSSDGGAGCYQVNELSVVIAPALPKGK